LDIDKQYTGKWPIGTKVARFFDTVGEWFAGEVKKYINEENEDLYWIIYSNGDKEDFDAGEMQEGVDNYRTHFGGTDPGNGNSEDAALDNFIDEDTAAEETIETAPVDSSSDAITVAVVARAGLGGVATMSRTDIQPLTQQNQLMMVQHQQFQTQLLQQQQQMSECQHQQKQRLADIQEKQQQQQQQFQAQLIEQQKLQQQQHQQMMNQQLQLQRQYITQQQQQQQQMLQMQYNQQMQLQYYAHHMMHNQGSSLMSQHTLTPQQMQIWQTQMMVRRNQLREQAALPLITAPRLQHSTNRNHAT
jgi:hypothetical protein